MSPKAARARVTVDTQNDDEKETKRGSGSEPWVRHAISEIQAGRDEDRRYFELIFRHYEPRCIGLLRALGLKRDLDDLVQEIMLRVYRGIDDFRSEASFDTWFTHIVKNVARNAFRDRNTKKARAETSLDSLLEPKHEGDPALPEPEDHRPDPLEITLGAERAAELESLLRELPPKTRQSMLLYYIHGYEQSEIAALRGTSVNTVKKQLVDGRKRIRPLFSIFAELFMVLLVLLVIAG